MTAIRRFTPIFALLIISILACQTYIIGDLLTQPGDMLFTDDFSDPNSGWARTFNTGGAMDYFSNGYRLWVNAVDYDIWSIPGLDFSDVRIEVDAAKIGGPDENRLGIICRYKDSLNFYFFIVSSDGYYAIGKASNGQRILLGQEMMNYHAAINTGTEVNHLRADCVRNLLMFFVNGSPVASAQDTGYTSGDVGLLAGAFDQTGVDVIFDNFIVIKP